jgi:hypothetical protein
MNEFGKVRMINLNDALAAIATHCQGMPREPLDGLCPTLGKDMLP